MRVVDKAYDTGVKPALNAYDRMNSDPKFNEKPALPPRDNASLKGSLPPISTKPGTLQAGDNNVAGRTPSPLGQNTGAIGEKVAIPSQTDTLLASKGGPPSYTETVSAEPGKMSTQASPISPSSATDVKGKRPLLNRLFLAGEVVLTSLEATAHELINTGTAAASSAAG